VRTKPHGLLGADKKKDMGQMGTVRFTFVDPVLQFSFEFLTDISYTCVINMKEGVPVIR